MESNSTHEVNSLLLKFQEFIFRFLHSFKRTFLTKYHEEKQGQVFRFDPNNIPVANEDWSLLAPISKEIEESLNNPRKKESFKDGLDTIQPGQWVEKFIPPQEPIPVFLGEKKEKMFSKKADPVVRQKIDLNHQQKDWCPPVPEEVEAREKAAKKKRMRSFFHLGTTRNWREFKV
jgi:hypothetical protein